MRKCNSGVFGAILHAIALPQTLLFAQRVNSNLLQFLFEYNYKNSLQLSKTVLLYISTTINRYSGTGQSDLRPSGRCFYLGGFKDD